MAKPVIKVCTKEAVDLIRSGASDAILMEKYGLSFAGLFKLFKKLVDAKEIEQSELDHRALSLPQTVSVSRVLADVIHESQKHGNESENCTEAGLARDELLHPKRLCLSVTENSPETRIQAGEATSRQIDERMRARKNADEVSPDLENSAFSLPEDDPWHRNYKKWTFSGFVHRHKVTIAGLMGGIVGMAAMAAGLFIFVGFEKMPIATLKLSPKSAVDSEAARSYTDKQVREATEILQAIARDRNDTEKSGELAFAASDFRECLNNCKKSCSGGQENEKSELANCQRECLNKHSELFKKIRQKYYGRTE
jgi:hypothetical protein